MMLEFNDFATCFEDGNTDDGFVATPLADLLCVWDCDSGAWVAGTPALLRFEDEDALVAPAGKRTITMVGAVDATDATTLSDLVGQGRFEEDACLCWRRCDLLDDLIGEERSLLQLLAVLLERGAKGGLFLDKT